MSIPRLLSLLAAMVVWGTASPGAEIPLRILPPHEIRAVTIRSGGEPFSLPVRDGKLLVPDDLPMPWTVGMLRFDETTYTARDRERNVPLVLRKHGQLLFRLRPGPPPEERVTVLALRDGDPTASGYPATLGEEGVVRLWLSAGIYAAAIASDAAATRIRSGIVVEPGASTDAGTLPFEPVATVTVRVLDEATRRPVAGATLRWSPPDALNADVARILFRNQWSSTTDRAGRASFRIGPPPISVRWTVEALEYARGETARVTITGPDRTAMPDAFLRRETPLLVETFLPRHAEDFRDAMLVLADPESDDSPRFEPSARQRLRAEGNEFRLASWGRKRLAIESASRRTLFYQDFDLGPADRRVTLTPAPCDLTGRVGRDDDPVEGALVTVADPRDARVVLGQAKTDVAGRYRISVYQVGDVLVYTNVPAREGGSVLPALKRVALAGEAEARVDFSLPRAGAMIRVVDRETSRPVRATIRGRLTDGSGASRGITIETDAEGRGELDGAPRGTAALFVRAPEYRGREITIEINEHRADVLVELSRGGAIAGRVLDRYGTPLSGARLVGGFRSPLAVQPLAEAVTDGAGRFRLTNVPEEARTFYVIARGHALGIAALREDGLNEIRLSPPNTGAATLVAGNSPPKTLDLYLPARGAEIVPYGALHELAVVNGMTPFQLMSSGTDGTLVLPEFLPEGAFALYVATPPRPGSAERYRKVADLLVPLPSRAIVNLQ